MAACSPGTSAAIDERRGTIGKNYPAYGDSGAPVTAAGNQKPYDFSAIDDK
ncbi:MAG TPA: hypothetical protein VHU84_01935 [Lacipirellulaceae bacterium]|nr:hypothetical protein [Lacipirellulaceae bacterium]